MTHCRAADKVHYCSRHEAIRCKVKQAFQIVLNFILFILK